MANSFYDNVCLFVSRNLNVYAFRVCVVLVWGLWKIGSGFLLVWFRVELLFRQGLFWGCVKVSWGTLGF